MNGLRAVGWRGCRREAATAVAATVTAATVTAASVATATVAAAAVAAATAVPTPAMRAARRVATLSGRRQLSLGLRPIVRISDMLVQNNCCNTLQLGEIVCELLQISTYVRSLAPFPPETAAYGRY